MASIATAAPISRAEFRATRLLFFAAGCAVAVWAALVPFAKARTGLNEASLGALLLCLGMGSLIAMPLAGAWTTRQGCRIVLVACTIVSSLMLPLLAWVPSVIALGAVLFVFGAAIGAADCAFNVQAVIVEEAAGRPMMSGFHGFFSLGGIVGAAGAAGMMSLGMAPLAMTVIWTAFILLLLAFNWRGLLPYGSPHEGPLFAVPHGFVLLLGVLGFVVFLTEGAMLDWSAVFLTEQRGMASAQAGFGYACFALAMTAGRFAGDAIVARLGPSRVVWQGGLLAAAGITLSALLPEWQWSLLGYTLVGLGCSNIVPVLFTAAGRQKVMPQALAVPAMTTIAYAGVLTGPAGIGFIAHHSSLPTAFLLLAAMMVGVATCGRAVRT
nr:MFS transporter [Pseudoxanthomonas sp.]